MKSHFRQIRTEHMGWLVERCRTDDHARACLSWHCTEPLMLNPVQLHCLWWAVACLYHHPCVFTHAFDCRQCTTVQVMQAQQHDLTSTSCFSSPSVMMTAISMTVSFSISSPVISKSTHTSGFSSFWLRMGFGLQAQHNQHCQVPHANRCAAAARQFPAEHHHIITPCAQGLCAPACIRPPCGVHGDPCRNALGATADF